MSGSGIHRLLYTGVFRKVSYWPAMYMPILVGEYVIVSGEEPYPQSPAVGSGCANKTGVTIIL